MIGGYPNFWGKGIDNKEEIEKQKEEKRLK